MLDAFPQACLCEVDSGWDRLNFFQTHFSPHNVTSWEEWWVQKGMEGSPGILCDDQKTFASSVGFLAQLQGLTPLMLASWLESQPASNSSDSAPGSAFAVLSAIDLPLRNILLNTSPPGHRYVSLALHFQCILWHGACKSAVVSGHSLALPDRCLHL